MIFYNILNALIESEFDIRKLLFSDLLGFSSKSAKKYMESSMSVGSRQFNQLNNRLSQLKVKSKDDVTGLLAEELLNVHTSIIENKPHVMSSSRDGYELAILNECKKLNVTASDLELDDIPWHYSISFVDSVSLPFRTYGAESITEELIYSNFPYNVYEKNKVDYYLKKSQQEGGIKKEDEVSVTMIFDAFIAVMAAIYLDIKRQNEILYDGGMDFWQGFFEGAWTSDNAQAYFFIRIRERSGKRTYDEFYQYLANEVFTGLDFESVKTNYKRWCKTGSIKKEQWMRLVGTNDLLSEEYILIRLEFSLAVLFQQLKTIISETNINFSLDDFKVDLIRWCDAIESEFPLGNWQPFKATS
jgi:hypothetical protein